MRRTFAIAAFALALTSIARGQAAVELQLSAKHAFAGEAFVVGIEVTSFQEADAPQWPPLDGATVRQLGSSSESSFISIIGNRRTETRSRTWQYELTPTRVGTLVIPPVTVQADGKPVRTREVTIDVKPSDREKYFEATVAIDADRVYVGQRVRATMTIWVRPPIFNGRRVHPNTIWSRIVNASDLGPFPAEVRNPESVLRERDAGDGRMQWYAFDLSADAIVDQPGPLNIGRISVGIEYPMQNGSRNFRAQPTFPPIEVLPVPMEGRPREYAGAVGLYAIDARATPTSVRVGDPIELTIEVSGDGPLSTLPPPLLTANTALQSGFRLPDEPLAGENANGRRRFSLVIRATSDEVKEVPAIEYPYFDPRAERFVVARSKPIPLTVAPVAQVEGVDVSRLGAGKAQSSSEGAESLDGLRDIETRESTLLATCTDAPVALVQTLLIAPPIAFVGIWFASAALQRRADPAARRRSRAARSARAGIQAAERLAPREAAAAISSALSQYLADRRGEPPASWIGAAVGARLLELGVAQDTARRVVALFERCASASFGGVTDQTAGELASEASACISELEGTKL